MKPTFPMLLPIDLVGKDYSLTLDEFPVTVEHTQILLDCPKFDGVLPTENIYLQRLSGAGTNLQT